MALISRRQMMAATAAAGLLTRVVTAQAQSAAVAGTTAITEPNDLPFRIKSVNHTGITVSSLDEALSLWVGAIGFEHLYTWDFENSPFVEELVGVEDAALRLAMVEGPGHLIELLEYRAPDGRQVVKPRSCDVGSVHVAFYVANLNALLARLSTMGWRALGDVQTIESGERAGLSLVYVRGPDGVTLEFLQLPEDGHGGSVSLPIVGR